LQTDIVDLVEQTDAPPFAARTLNGEELTQLVSSYDRELSRAPLLAVLDTSCVRTGLQYQLANGFPPASIGAARDGSIRLFMEYETLVETRRKLPKFARDFGVSAAELAHILNRDWLPDVRIVRLPPELREIDPRARAVRERDPDDYPAGALAALLSPCILLTHNFRDFEPLGLKTWGQGVDAVVAGIELRAGEFRMSASVMVPVVPFVAVGGAAKWASNRIGPEAWFILGVVVIAAIWLYARQPEERRDRIKNGLGKAGTFILEEAAKAVAEVSQARADLTANAVPRPDSRSTIAAVLRNLASSEESLSAQQIADALDESVRPPVTELRAYLHANDKTLVYEVRRGGFVLGQHYRLKEEA
jgi:hypothetical protein